MVESGYHRTRVASGICKIIDYNFFLVYYRLIIKFLLFYLLLKTYQPIILDNKLASLGATLVRNSAHWLNDSLTGVKCRATSVAKNDRILHNMTRKRFEKNDIQCYLFLFRWSINKFCTVLHSFGIMVLNDQRPTHAGHAGPLLGQDHVPAATMASAWKEITGLEIHCHRLADLNASVCTGLNAQQLLYTGLSGLVLGWVCDAQQIRGQYFWVGAGLPKKVI